MTITLARFLGWFLKGEPRAGATVRFVLGDRELDVMNAAADKSGDVWTVRLEEQQPISGEHPTNATSC